MKSSFVKGFLACMLVTGGCQNKDPEPIVKETITGSVNYIYMQIVGGGVAIVQLNVLDDMDGRTYEINMAERGGMPFPYNSFAYIESTSLILPATKEVPFGGRTYSSQFAVHPILSTNNAVHISYLDNAPDSRFSTKEITGRLTPETILIIGSDEEEAIAILRTDAGIQQFLKPILLDCLNNDFAKDVNPTLEGDQGNPFLSYRLEVETQRRF